MVEQLLDCGSGKASNTCRGRKGGGGVVGRGRALWMSPIIECVGVMLGRMVTRFALTGAMLVFGRRARVGRERKSRMHCARRVVSL